MATLLHRPAVRVLLATLALLVACSAQDCLDRCDSSKVVHPDPVAWPGGRSAAIATPDFRFSLEQFNWEIQGSELVSVNAKGEVVHVFYGHGVDPSSGAQRISWHRRSFALPSETVRALQALLREEAFTELGAAYVDNDIQDGVIDYFTLRASGKTKRVQCSNWFPSALTRLKAFALQRLAEAAPKGARIEEISEIEARLLTASRGEPVDRGRGPTTPQDRYSSEEPYKIVLIAGRVFLKLVGDDSSPFGPFEFVSPIELAYQHLPGERRRIALAEGSWWYSDTHVHMRAARVDEDELWLLETPSHGE